MKTFLLMIVPLVENGVAPCKKCGQTAQLFNVHTSGDPNSKPVIRDWCFECVDQHTTQFHHMVQPILQGES